jgi:hypothetical protein
MQRAQERAVNQRLEASGHDGEEQSLPARQKVAAEGGCFYIVVVFSLFFLV